jgi:hypothetical protein
MIATNGESDSDSVGAVFEGITVIAPRRWTFLFSRMLPEHVSDEDVGMAPAILLDGP